MTEGESKLVQLYDEQLQARIRELEAENAELHRELDGFALMQRIAKAKAILNNATCMCGICNDAMLAALEGLEK